MWVVDTLSLLYKLTLQQRNPVHSQLNKALRHNASALTVIKIYFWNEFNILAVFHSGFALISCRDFISCWHNCLALFWKHTNYKYDLFCMIFIVIYVLISTRKIYYRGSLHNHFWFSVLKYNQVTLLIFRAK